MSHEFQSTLFCTARAMCDAIAYEWMTAGGLNTSAEIDQFAAQGAQFYAEECIEGWGLLRVVDEDTGTTWLAARDANASMVLHAFEMFFETRPDRHTSKADEHALLLNAASGIAAFERAAVRAACDALAEERNSDSTISALEFADGSRIALDYSARCASVEQ